MINTHHFTMNQTIVRDTSPLASVQLVHSPTAIPGRDLIVIAKVQGYTVVVKKDDFFRDGDSTLCVFFEPDSLLDEKNDEFKFLECKGQRLVTTKKMYKVYSQGLCFPLSIVTHYGLSVDSLVEGQDLTEALQVTKYVSPEESGQYYPDNRQPDASKNLFPVHLVPKTDEKNLQSFGRVLEKIQNRPITVTMKLDGCSMTVTDEGHLCGRNFEWLEQTPSNAHYFAMDAKYQIRDKIKGTGYRFQGEIVGPKIQKNPMGLPENDWFVFNVYKDGKYLTHPEVVDLCAQMGFKTVPCLQTSNHPLHTVDDWLTFADAQRYHTNGAHAEGIVVKTADHEEPRYSFKVISRYYLVHK